MKQEYQTGDRLSIKVGEHNFITPPIHKHEDILFHNLPTEKQFWKRQKDFPKIFYDWHNEQHSLGIGVELDAKKTEYHPDSGILISLNKHDTTTLFGNKEDDGIEGFQTREYRRRTEGLWFYNNGELTYITGDHYGALQWYPMLGCENEVEPGSSYGQYYQFQRDVCYYFLICEETELAYGGLEVKPKKTGITQLVSSIGLNRALIKRQKNIRMMSITESVAKEINFRFIRYSLESIPPILMPSRSKQNEGEVVFGAPNASRNPLKKRKEMNLSYLNNWLCTVPTGRTSFDSATNYLAIIDEFPKIKDSTYPKELFTATLVAVREGVKRKGTVFGLSYVPEITNRSFYEANYNSKLKTRQRDENGNQYGKTKSELLAHCLTVQEGIFGCCDKYGKPDLDKIWKYINEETTKVKNDPQALQALKRQFPTSEQDAWGESSREDSLFDNVRLGQRRMELEEQESMGELPLDFNLKYSQEPTKQKIGEKYDFKGNIILDLVTDEAKMKGAEHGKYKWYHKEWTPDWYLNKHINKLFVHQKNKLLAPNPHSPFFISIDPTSYKTKKYTGVGSLNAIQAFLMPDAELNANIGQNVSNYRLMIEYLYRQDNPKETLHDMIRLILFLGCYVQIECNMSTWAENLIEMGLGNFLLMLNKEGALQPWNGSKDQMLFTSQKETIGQYVLAGAEHLAAPITPEGVDNIQYIDSIPVLTQLSQLKVEDTKEYDAAVAYLEGIMGMKALLGWRRADEERKKRTGDGSISTAFYGMLGSYR